MGAIKINGFNVCTIGALGDGEKIYRTLQLLAHFSSCYNIISTLDTFPKSFIV